MSYRPGRQLPGLETRYELGCPFVLAILLSGLIWAALIVGVILWLRHH